MQNKEIQKQDKAVERKPSNQTHYIERGGMAFHRSSRDTDHLNSLPVLLPMSPTRVRPSTSPSKSNNYKKTLKTNNTNSMQHRRHTYSSTPSLFNDASSLSKEERLSYLNYKSTQYTQRNKTRKKKKGNVVNKMASMLAKYDEVHGLKKRMSPQRSNRKTINSIDSLREKVFPKL
jgi:hypothetical protein